MESGPPDAGGRLICPTNGGDSGCIINSNEHGMNHLVIRTNLYPFGSRSAAFCKFLILLSQFSGFTAAPWALVSGRNPADRCATTSAFPLCFFAFSPFPPLPLLLPLGCEPSRDRSRENNAKWAYVTLAGAAHAESPIAIKSNRINFRFCIINFRFCCPDKRK